MTDSMKQEEQLRAIRNLQDTFKMTKACIYFEKKSRLVKGFFWYNVWDSIQKMLFEDHGETLLLTVCISIIIGSYR